ncbi:helix-turn-helix domain-containing protein [Massilia pinisoli]|uniref:Helix-turn-helix domain-containing protein n=1 Tax=Massilia pinisoli TaxID=1772194 RepID=A0ABT1ZRV2_9BURK|nr:helix-turn-helix domain-containing protein [Massilia pinisoli]MCS0582616.1 helix-turn-helix domain-containing protein [Massilia pinisoli]
MSNLPTVTDRAKGVVAPALAGRMFRLGRYLPPPDLAPFLDHYWIVEWDLRGRPAHTQRTLPYPCVHVVFDRARTGIWGVTTGPFDYELKEAGKVCGLRFRPGAFRAFLGRPLHTITDQVLPLSAVFPWDEAAAQDAVLDTPDDTAMVDAANALLRTVLPAPDPQVDKIAAILRAAEGTPGLTQVEVLAGVAGMGVRSLQALFSEYVGVSPKWVIRRFRLHEAADRLVTGADVDLATLAQGLGYFDQAHFTSDFRRLVGKSPGRYREEARRTAGA